MNDTSLSYFSPSGEVGTSVLCMALSSYDFSVASRRALVESACIEGEHCDDVDKAILMASLGG